MSSDAQITSTECLHQYRRFLGGFTESMVYNMDHLEAALLQKLERLQFIKKVAHEIKVSARAEHNQLLNDLASCPLDHSERRRMLLKSISSAERKDYDAQLLYDHVCMKVSVAQFTIYSMIEKNKSFKTKLKTDVEKACVYVRSAAEHLDEYKNQK